MSQRTFWIGAALFALTLLAFAPAMGGGFIWDDDDYVTHNGNLRSADGLYNIWFVPRSSPQYYPLVHTSFWIEQHLWSLNPAGYHVVNIVLHAICVLLLWRLLVMLEIPGAWLAAAIFAVHPVQAESVAWVTERKNVLSGVFYFASALSYVAWASRPSDRAERSVKTRAADRRERSGETPKPLNERFDGRYVLALLLFIAALLSKTVTCSLPAALALILWWKQGTVTKRQWISLAPMFVIGFALAMVTARLEVAHVEAIGREWNYGAADRILIAGRAVWFYLSKLVLPVNLSFIYPKWPIDARLAWQWAFPVAVVIALLALWQMRNRWGRGPLVAAMIYVGTLVPALGFFNIYPMRYSFVADHFQYHAVAAMAVLIAAALCRVLGKWRLIVLVPLVMLTMIRSRVLADSDTLWRDAVAKNPQSWMVHLNLARTLVERGKSSEADEHFARQAELGSDLPETHWNLGVNYARRGMLAEALAEYDRAIAIDVNFPQAYYARGRVYVQLGQLEKAEAELTRAVELKPDYALAENELGEVLVHQKKAAQALEHFLAAVAADPSLATAHVNLAALLAAMGKTDEAIQQFNAAVQIDPSLEQYRGRVLGAGL